MPREMDGSPLTHVITRISALSLNTTHYSTWTSRILSLSGIPLGKSDFSCLCLPLCAVEEAASSALQNLLNLYSRNMWKSLIF